jgi:hypothetical protein
MLDFYKTSGGRRFCDTTMPGIMRELNRVADAMEKANRLKEQEIRLKEQELNPLLKVSEEFVEDKVGMTFEAAAEAFVQKIVSQLADDSEMEITDEHDKIMIGNRSVILNLSGRGISVECDRTKDVITVRRIV